MRASQVPLPRLPQAAGRSADILGIPVVRPKIVETTALGVAYAAGLAVGVWGSLDAVSYTHLTLPTNREV